MPISPPINAAIRLVRRACYAALSPLVPTYGGIPACYWRKADDAPGLVQALTSTPPTIAGCIVYQSQDGGGQAVNALGSADWAGLITVRCMAGTQDAADALLATLPEPLILVAPTGYSIRADYERPLDLSPTDGVYTAASSYRVTMSRN